MPPIEDPNVDRFLKGRASVAPLIKDGQVPEPGGDLILVTLMIEGREVQLPAAVANVVVLQTILIELVKLNASIAEVREQLRPRFTFKKEK